MHIPKRHHKYGIYSNNVLTHSFGDLPALLSFLDTDQDGIIDTWQQLIEQDTGLELRNLSTGAVIYTSDTSKTIDSGSEVTKQYTTNVHDHFAHRSDTRNANASTELSREPRKHITAHSIQTILLCIGLIVLAYFFLL